MADISKVKTPDGNTYNVKDSTARDLIANKADKTVATTSANGLMSKTDKAKLDGIDPSAITTNAANIKKNADAISAETTRAKKAEAANTQLTNDLKTGLTSGTVKVAKTRSADSATALGSVTAKFFAIPDNGARKKYLLFYDISEWISKSRDAGTYAYDGYFFSRRSGGYVSNNYTGTLSMVASYNGMSGSTPIKSDNSESLRLRTTSEMYKPVILHNTSTNKYYLALETYGNGRDLVLFGIFQGTFVGTWVQNVGQFLTPGTLPDGYELYSEGYVSIPYERAIADKNGKDITEYFVAAAYADGAFTFTRGNGDKTVLTIPDAVSNTVNSHIANKANPHGVTKAQVGLGSVANLDQSKAIKSITRSGTTFTATALDGTTTTFTQQDNNTTYGLATSSADGLMSKADKAKLDGIAAGAEFIDAIKACPPAISHRMIYRGKNLGTSFTTEQSQAVQNGTFTDMYVGDYWVINGKTRRIGDIDYFYGCGDTSLDQHHLLIVDDGVDLAGDGSTTHFMNDTDTTAGGFKGSKMWQSTIPNQILPDIITAFGSHLLTHREYISNAVTDGVPSDGEWVDTTYNLFNETMYYGSVVNGANIGGAGVFNIGCSKNQIALFKLDQSSMNRRNSIWLRDVVSNTAFALAYSFGYATGGFTSFPWFSILGYYLIH